MSAIKNQTTQPLQSLDELKRSEATFRAMFETSAVGIGIMGLDRKIMDANPAICRMFGRTREQFIGVTPAVATLPEDYSRSTEEFQELLDGKREYYWDERRYVRMNGEVFWAHVTMSIVRDDSGAPLYMVGMVIDIDDRKRAMEELSESVERFRATFDSSAIGMGLLGLDGKVLRANTAVCKILGYTEDELKQHHEADYAYPEDSQVGSDLFAELVAGTRDSYQVEKRFIRKNGEVFWACLSLAGVRDVHGHPQYLVGMIDDIDEQKRTMADLQTSEARFRAMFENAGVGIALVGMDRRPLAVNDGLVRISGRTREELLGTTGVMISHPEDVEIDKAEFAKLVAGELNSYQVERRYIRKEGVPYWVRQTISAVRNQDGQLMYLVVMVEDIDQQKRDEESVLESEARFRAMFESSAMGVLILDVSTLSVRANSAALAMLDDPDVYREHKDIYEFIHVRYREAERELFDQLLNGKRDSYEAERHYQRPGEESKWAKVTFSAIRDVNGQLRYIVAMLDDITELKKAQEKLSQSEARFRAMFDNTSVGIALTDLDRKILQVNEAAARITGYSAAELSMMNPVDLAVPEDRLVGQDVLHEMIDGKRDSMTVERRYQRKNGDIFWGRVTYTLVREANRQPLYLIGLIEDINEQKLAAEKMAAQEAEYLRTLEQRVQERTTELSETNLRLVNEIEHRQKAEDALASKAVEDAITAERTRLARDLHDAVTQTLFSASLIAEVLPEIWDMDEAEARRSTEELRQLTRGALAEMRTLLLELRPAALTQARFPDLLKQLSEAVIGRARLPINLNVKGDYEMPPEVKVAFYRIAQESLNNVVKYARATQVEIQLRQECCNVHLEVRDNGIGFDPISIKPTSLGMRIMSERAEAIHAHFKVTSVPGQGTTVSLDWNEDELIPISKILTRGEA